MVPHLTGCHSKSESLVEKNLRSYMEEGQGDFDECVCVPCLSYFPFRACWLSI